MEAVGEVGRQRQRGCVCRRVARVRQPLHGHARVVLIAGCGHASAFHRPRPGPPPGWPRSRPATAGPAGNAS
ncbi:conserved hypothetical protein [Ricinus communis]|uniref:Uncharacterized protein n=1 Tax=Ricinus communis TaxID=3988 RepID=B9TMH0_RICCO|nr:conserved hypothetical protein [Ricinus communis]